MDINVGGIVKKLEDNAALATFLFVGYSRFDTEGGISELIRRLTGAGLWEQLQYSLGSVENLKWKLFDSGYLYSGAFKMALVARLLAEIDILPAKYKKLTESIMLGSGIAAVVLPGSTRENPSNPNANPDTTTGRRGAELPTNQNLTLNVGAY